MRTVNHNSVVRLHILKHRRTFVAAVAATVAAHPGITESDLMGTLRGGSRSLYDPPSFLYWTFGAYDFRACIGEMVGQGVLKEHAYPRKTTYSVDPEKHSAVFALWKQEYNALWKREGANA